MSPCSMLNSESMSPPTPNTQASSSISLRISNYFLPCPWKQIFEILNFPECQTALCASCFCFCFCVTLCAFCFWEEGRFKITMSTPQNYLVGKIRRFSQCHTIKWRGSVTGGAPVALFISEKNNCKQNLGKKSLENAQTSKHAIGQHPDSKTIIRTLKILAAQMQSTCQISKKNCSQSKHMVLK